MDFHVVIQAFNERPGVPGRLIALRQSCVSLLEAVRMWLRQQHDLSGEEEKEQEEEEEGGSSSATNRV